MYFAVFAQGMQRRFSSNAASFVKRALRNPRALYEAEIANLLTPLDYKIVIIGRPNAGKSTLANRLVGQKKAIVHKSPGMTRDRKELKANLAGLSFTIVDTPGLEEPYDKTDDRCPETQVLSGEAMNLELQIKIQDQTERALHDADVVLFMFDARAGVEPSDKNFALRIQKYLREFKAMAPRWWLERRKPEESSPIPEGSGHVDLFPSTEYEEVKIRIPVICIANKCEEPADQRLSRVMEGFSLGFDEPVQISAEQNDGMADLHAALLVAMLKMYPVKHNHHRRLQAAVAQNKGQEQVRLVIAGKPNVGKSTLINCILGEERMVVGSQPGVTRDSVGVDFFDPRLPGFSFHLMDTAGLKGVQAKAWRDFSQADSLSMKDSVHCIQYANVVALVIDASDGLEEAISLPLWKASPEDLTRDQILQLEAKVARVLSKDDMAVARKAETEGRALIMVANKMDRIAVGERASVLEGLRNLLLHVFPQNKGLTVLGCSGSSGEGVEKLLPAVISVYQQWSARTTTGPLNRWLRKISEFKPHPKLKGKPVKFKYMTQIKTRPPTFNISCNYSNDTLSPAYLRYFVNAMREEFNLLGTPVRVHVLKTKNPYVGDSTGDRPGPARRSPRK